MDRSQRGIHALAMRDDELTRLEAYFEKLRTLIPEPPPGWAERAEPLKAVSRLSGARRAAASRAPDAA